MKKFLKENSYTIVRLIVFQIGSGILGIITSFATSSLEAKWVFPASSVFCIAFYLFLVFNMSYEDGQKDGIRIEAGRMKKNPYKYFIIGLLANSVNLLVGFMALAFCLVGMSSPTETILSLEQTFAAISRFLHTMYLGIVQSLFGMSTVPLAFVPIPTVIAAGVGYLMGIRYKDGFLLKRQDKNNTKRYS